MLFNDKARFGGSTPGSGGTSERKGLRALAFLLLLGSLSCPGASSALRGACLHCHTLLYYSYQCSGDTPLLPFPPPPRHLHLYLPGIPSSPCQFRQRLQTLPPIPEVQLPPTPGKKRTLNFVTPQMCAKRGEARRLGSC